MMIPCLNYLETFPSFSPKHGCSGLRTWALNDSRCSGLRTWALNDSRCSGLRTWALNDSRCSGLRTWALNDSRCSGLRTLALNDSNPLRNAKRGKERGGTDFAMWIFFLVVQPQKNTPRGL